MPYFPPRLDGFHGCSCVRLIAVISSEHAYQKYLSSVSVCLINHLLLNLRRESSRYNEESNGATSTTVTNTHLIFTTRIMGKLTAELITPSEEEQDAYNYTSGAGGSRSSTNRFSPSASAYTTGLSFVSVRSNLSRQTGLTDSLSYSQSAIPSVGIASGSGRYSPNAVLSGSGQRGESAFVLATIRHRDPCNGC